MSGDIVYAELSAAKVAIAAAQGTDGSKSLKTQHQITRTYLSERAIGTLLLFCAIAMGAVWLIETPELIQYTVTAVTTVLALG